MTKVIYQPQDRAGAAEVGGKAAALSELVALGFDVPQFFVLTPDAFAKKGLSAAGRRALSGALAELGDGPFAVRSSAREEDGVSHSHAGQFLSLLDIDAGGVAAAATKVWRSGMEVSVREYRTSKGLDADGGAPAVVIQKMVDARCAGVAFSADPVSGRSDRVVVSAIKGLADQLVGGEVDGDDYILGKTDGAVIEGPDDGVLTSGDLTALLELAVRAEDAFGRPQDIEWAFNDNRLLLLQARAITTALRAEPIADTHTTVLDNSNIVESYPGLVTPLTYSFAQYAYARVYRMFVSLVGVREDVVRDNMPVFENMLSRVDCRVYYNLVNWYRALALLPGFSINRAHMETMMGVSEPLPPEIADGIGPRPAKGLGLVREWLRVGRVGLKLCKEALFLKRMVRDYYGRLNSALAEPAGHLDTMPLSALAGEYRRIEADLLDRWDAPLVNDFLCMMAFGASRSLLEKWAGEEGLQVHNDIMIGQGDIVSAEPAQRITRMGALIAGDEALIDRLAAADVTALDDHAALAQEVAGYIEKFSDRCTEELKLESITLQEDPTPLLVSIAAAARSGRPEHQARTSGAERLRDVFKGKPVKRMVAGWIVNWAKARVRDRENLRFERTRIFGRARHLFLAVGRQMHAHGLIEEPRDVLYLTVQEVLGAIEGFGVTSELSGLVAVRKAEMEAAMTRPDPPERLLVDGAVITGLDTASHAGPAEQSNEKLRSGTGCSAGRVTAKARVVRDPRTEHLDRGEILVARHTDPGWIAVFTNASAIVVERGSLLSHSAIVARELGIPCVVGLKGAMEWIESGEDIEVDGATGTVRKVHG